jgi:predicted acylesterase/phospholipase RssA
VEVEVRRDGALRREAALALEGQNRELKTLVADLTLDSARRVSFGESPSADVPICTAVAAALATPGFFEPVPLRGRQFIDGNAGTVARLDLASARGISDVLVVTPRAPVVKVSRSCVVPGERGDSLSLRELEETS